MKIHSSCEVKYFVETHICKLCVILRLRVLRVVCPLVKDIGRRLPLQLKCSYQGQQGDVSHSVRGNFKPVSEADIIGQLWKQMHPFTK